LQEKYGVGILALYHHGHSFDKKDKVSIDDPNVSDEETELLLAYLSQDNPESRWLTRICNIVNPYIESGLEGTLVMTQMLVEFWDNVEIHRFKERSDKLAVMCLTRTDHSGPS
jgi:hypothetical protein